MPARALSRRKFLSSAALAGAACAGLRPESLWGQTAALTAAGLAPGKLDSFKVHKASPLVLESTPDALVPAITPAKALFVRNNQDVPGANTLAPFEGREWNVQLTGLLNKDATVSLEQLRSWPQTSVEMVLQCSGNRRAKFSQFKPTEGTQWGSGGIGNVTFRGVKLTTVLEKLGVELKPEAWYMTADGIDGPKAGEPDFIHSTPVADVLQTALLALDLNGQPLPRVHGGPVRLVIPGYYATVSAKWVTSLRFEAQETTNFNHASRYRTPLSPIVPGSEYNFTIPNSVPTWRMKIATLVTQPQPGGPRGRLAGWAWNDGRAKLTAVMASVNGGSTWQHCEFQAAVEPLYRWQDWVFDLPPQVQLGERPATILIRAEDELGRTQPISGTINWNPHGYEWHAAESVTV